MRGIMVISLFLFLLPIQSHAFKWSKCKKVYKSWGITQNNSKSIGKVLIDYLAQMTSQATFQSSTSTTSFVSSTSDCAAFAKAEEERHFYVSQSLVELQAEASQGKGEHIESLASLYGCPTEVQSSFGEMLKTHHGEIFEGPTTKPVTERITDQVMKTNGLGNRCNLEKI